jgi:hypothetical protein
MTINDVNIFHNLLRYIVHNIFFCLNLLWHHDRCANVIARRRISLCTYRKRISLLPSSDPLESGWPTHPHVLSQGELKLLESTSCIGWWVRISILMELKYIILESRTAWLHARDPKIINPSWRCKLETHGRWITKSSTAVWRPRMFGSLGRDPAYVWLFGSPSMQTCLIGLISSILT